MLLHMLFAVVIPNFNFSSTVKKPQLIKVELQKPAPPAPVIEELPPINIPEPPKPKPPEPVKRKVKPIVKPKPIKKEAPAPIEPPVEITPPPVVEEVIAVQPVVESTPEVVVPVPEPTPVEPPLEPAEIIPQGPSDKELRAARDSYLSTLFKLAKNNVKRSKLAERRGLEGKQVVTLRINASGKIVDVYLCKSSGHSTLDKSALKGFKSLSDLPLPKYLEVFSMPNEQKTTCTEDTPEQKNGYGINIPITYKNGN